MKKLFLALILIPTLCLGDVTFQANGNTTVTASTGTCTPATTTLGTIDTNDIVLVVACGEGDGVGGTLALTTANSFALVTSTGVTNPLSTDPDADALEENPEIDCAVWWRRGPGSMPVITDSGDHTTCAAHRFAGAVTSGDPWDVAESGNDSAANDTSANIPGDTTTVTNTLVVLIQGTSNNGTSTANCGAVTNADLGSITERFDSSSTTGLGGGHCIITGTKASASSYTTSTLTLSATTYKAAFSIALKPEPPPACTAGLNMTLLGVGGCP